MDPSGQMDDRLTFLCGVLNPLRVLDRADYALDPDQVSASTGEGTHVVTGGASGQDHRSSYASGRARNENPHAAP